MTLRLEIFLLSRFMRPDFFSVHTTARTGGLHFDGCRLVFFWSRWESCCHLHEVDETRFPCLILRTFTITEVYNSLHSLSFRLFSSSSRHWGNRPGIILSQPRWTNGLLGGWWGIFISMRMRTITGEQVWSVASVRWSASPWCDSRPAFLRGLCFGKFDICFRCIR